MERAHEGARELVNVDNEQFSASTSDGDVSLSTEAAAVLRE